MNKNPNKRNIFQRIFSDCSYCWISVMCTALIMLLVYFCYNLFPFGDTTILRMDLYHQYGPLFAELYDRVTGLKSMIYSWNTGLGGPFLGNYFNYLASPSAIFMLLLGHKNMPEAIAAMILAKAAFASGSFTLYLKKSQKRHDFTTAAFGVLYAMCGYFVAYYWNVMWIDAMVYFPMVMYGVERIINRRKPSVYIAALTLTLLSNYYMGYMTCIFSVIYFLVYFISNYEFLSFTERTTYYLDGEGNKQYKLKDKIKGSVLLRGGVTFGLASIASGALAAFALIPTFLILKSCSATSGTWPNGYRIYFSVFDFLANHLASVDPTIRSSGDDVLPNVFCGMGTLILVPLYLFSKKISLKEKIGSVFTLAIIYFSFSINYLNYIWHGFHFPNDLPYRFSFMYCFILLVMAYKAFVNLKEYTGRQILGSGVAVVFMIILVQEIGSKNVQDITVLLSVIFVVTYTLIFYLLKDEKRQKSAIAVILLCTVIAEIACANTDRYSMSQTKQSYAGDYNSFQQVKSVLDEREKGDKSYRMELTYNRARMDPAWFGYNGISTFSSMAYEKMANMQSNLGVYSNFINSYTYYMQTPVYNMMNSLKYIVDNDENVTIDDSNYYTQVATFDKFTAYQNNYYLPIAFTAGKGLKEWYSEYTNPFLTQGEWFELASGEEYVFEQMTVGEISYSNIDEIVSGFDTGDVYFTKTDAADDGQLTIQLTTESTQHCYLFVDSNDFEEVSVAKGDESHVQGIDEPYIYDLGLVSADNPVYVTVDVSSDKGKYCHMDFYPYYVNEDALAKGYKKLQSGAMDVETFDETYIAGTVKADKDQIVFTSIPYDKGWKVKVDGEPLKADDYIALEDAYLCFNIAKGEHKVEIKYEQRGLMEGIIISVAAILMLIIAAVLFKTLKPSFDNKYEAMCRKAQEDYDEMKREAERVRNMELYPEEIKLETGEYENSENAPEDSEKANEEDEADIIEETDEEPSECPSEPSDDEEEMEIAEIEDEVITEAAEEVTEEISEKPEEAE